MTGGPTGYSLTIVITDSQPSKAGLGLVPQAQRNCQRGSDPRSSIILDSLVSPPGSQGQGKFLHMFEKVEKVQSLETGKPCSFTNPLRAFEEKVSCKSKIQTKASWQCYAFLGLFHILNDLVPRFFGKPPMPTPSTPPSRPESHAHWSRRNPPEQAKPERSIDSFRFRFAKLRWWEKKKAD